MKFTLFVGCNIPVRVKQYEMAARAVSDRLGIKLEDNQEFKCCGNPIRNTDNFTYLLMAARNLALAEQQGLDMMVLCKCCFGSLKKAAFVLDQDPVLKETVNDTLSKEGLAYSGSVTIKHFLSVLYHDIGIKTLKETLSKTYKKLNIAAHHGCHALRPSEITQFDDPVAPVMFDALVKVTGAKSIDWSLKLECCGAPLVGVNDPVSTALTQKKLDNAKACGADFLCTACPFCQMQFDQIQKEMPFQNNGSRLPSLVFPQLLGLAMGIEKQVLGIEMNTIDINNIEYFLEE